MTEAIRTALLPLLAWLKEDVGCNFLTHGHCETSACFKRAGWPGRGSAKRFAPTCHVKELDDLVAKLLAASPGAGTTPPACQHCGSLNVHLVEAGKPRECGDCHQIAAPPASPLPPPTGWQPIETAPKDRKIVVLSMKAMRSEVTWWLPNSAHFAGFYMDVPTHWAELPPPPRSPARDV